MTIRPMSALSSAANRTVVFGALMLIGLALRLLIIPVYGTDPPQKDAAGYHTLAVNLVERHIFSQDAEPPFRPEFIRPFGYPLFVAAVYSVAGPKPFAVWVVQACVSTLIIPLMWAVARHVASDRRKPVIPLVVAGLTAINPLFIIYSAALLRETLATLLVVLIAWRVLAAWNRPGTSAWIGIGVLIGLAAQVRQELIVLGPAVIVALIVHLLGKKLDFQTTVKRSAALLIPSIAILGLWVAYYHAHYGRWSLGVGGDISITAHAIRVADESDSDTNLGRAIRAYNLRQPNESASPAYRLFHHLERDSNYSHIRATEVCGLWSREIAQRHPIKWIALAVYDAIVNSAGYTQPGSFMEKLLGTEKGAPMSSVRDRIILAPVEFVARVLIGGLVLIGLLIATFYWFTRMSAGIVLATMTGALIVSTALVGTYIQRVRTPIDAFMLCGAVIGWASLIEAIRSRKNAQRRRETVDNGTYVMSKVAASS